MHFSREGYVFEHLKKKPCPLPVLTSTKEESEGGEGRMVRAGWGKTSVSVSGHPPSDGRLQ